MDEQDQVTPQPRSGTSAEQAVSESTQAPPPADGYAGDISPQLAWQWVQDGQGLIVDVRSDAEREWVGFVPGAVPLALKQWPGMALNPDFDPGLRGLSAGKRLLMLCRSGVRSITAARRATELGLEAYNILEGFEGNPDPEGRRGRTGGWRFHGLPWRQN
ncbi:MAG: rhodanese-like domain-containing protein [Burkholderiales bacterium]